MNDSDLYSSDLDAVLQEDVQMVSDQETSVNLVIKPTDAASANHQADGQVAPESLETLRQRLKEKEEQLRTLQRELRLRDERILHLERLNAEVHGKAHGIQSEQIVAMGLVLESVTEPRVSHRISRITTTIGRAGNNDIVLNTHSVSRSHARIVVASDSTYLIDLQSSNGSAVNGERVSRQMINSGDIVKIGEVQFKFVTGAPKSEVEDRWMDETQALLDESIVFTRTPTPNANTEDKQVSEDAAKAKSIGNSLPI